MKLTRVMNFGRVWVWGSRDPTWIKPAAQAQRVTSAGWCAAAAAALAHAGRALAHAAPSLLAVRSMVLAMLVVAVSSPSLWSSLVSQRYPDTPRLRGSFTTSPYRDQR